MACSKVEAPMRCHRARLTWKPPSMTVPSPAQKGSWSWPMAAAMVSSSVLPPPWSCDMVAQERLLVAAEGRWWHDGGGRACEVAAVGVAERGSSSSAGGCVWRMWEACAAEKRDVYFDEKNESKNDRFESPGTKGISSRVYLELACF